MERFSNVANERSRGFERILVFCKQREREREREREKRERDCRKGTESVGGGFKSNHASLTLITSPSSLPSRFRAPRFSLFKYSMSRTLSQKRNQFVLSFN
jgi:hypothetical protein